MPKEGKTTWRCNYLYLWPWIRNWFNRNSEVIVYLLRHTVNPGDKIVIVDDLLATGGTANAAINLIQQQGGIVEAFLVVNVIKDLKGI